MSVSDASAKWGISSRRIQYLCNEGRIEGAIRIGKTWLIPITATKPEDGRRKTVPNFEIERHKMKLLVKRIILDLYNQKSNSDPKMAAYNALSYYAAFILISYCGKKHMVFGSYELSLIETNVKRIVPEYTLIAGDYNCKSINDNYQTILSNLDLLDDSLSWAYQYLKKYLANGLESTQFFTEKYMISTLTDSYQFSISEKIVDPSCGGGNFLVYVLNKKINSNHEQFANDPINTVVEALSSLWGYDLDRYLSLLSALNLLINASRILTKQNIEVGAEVLFNLKTNVYASVNPNIGGFLDCTNSAHLVENIMTGSRMKFSSFMKGTNYVFTNPPFQTIKGMNTELKEYLKKTSPNCNCDLCVAFLIKITDCLPKGSSCGLVLQNSWMYLSSFKNAREFIKENYQIDSIIVLGSSAFADISGEKASVSLTTITKQTPSSNISKYLDVASLERKEKEELLLHGLIEWTAIPQNSLFGISTGSDSGLLQKLSEHNPIYSDYATPMQATSTGDSKNLVDYYWLHIGDSDWKLVSKGGGFAKWAGLTRYVVKWGKNGEYIRATPGSALRNVQYFNQTQLVYSDTGTSGLNVRLLLDNQIFIASGPGIRIHSGNPYAHLAFLNSRYVSYCIKKFTPKLTIAAGYIAKIPINPELIESNNMSDLGFRCVQLKEELLSCCPTAIQYTGRMEGNIIDDMAEALVLKQIRAESEKLKLERTIDTIVYASLGLNDNQITEIEAYLCTNACDSPEYPSVYEIEETLLSILTSECSLSKTKVNRNALGCDGWLEYLADYYSIDPIQLARILKDNMGILTKLKKKYTNLVCHNLVLNALSYPTTVQSEIEIGEIVAGLSLCENDRNHLLSWIKREFNTIHANILFKRPLYKYSKEKGTIESVGGNNAY
ncbi:MAG: N-6 DNA methylase [Caldisericia bacterium]|nr:N-6 DNA methylase [Caldisericia bacterium]